MGNVVQTPFFDESQLEGKHRYVYNALRSALAERTDERENVAVIKVGPIDFAIKRELSPDAITCARVILDHPHILNGLQTKDLLEPNLGWEPFYHPMIAIIAMAIGIKEGFLRYDYIVDKVFANLRDADVKGYLESKYNIHLT